MTRAQKAATLHCSVALGCVDTLMNMETPKSARWNRLHGALEQLNRCIDLYRLEQFGLEDLNNASAVLDAVNDKIREFYP